MVALPSLWAVRRARQRAARLRDAGLRAGDGDSPGAAYPPGLGPIPMIQEEIAHEPTSMQQQIQQQMEETTVEVPIPMIQEEIAHEPTIMQQERVIQQHLGMVHLGKIDGILLPSAGLKLADFPSGITAVSKIPGEGLLQILAFAGAFETHLFKDKWFGPTFTSQYSAQRKLLAEINNDRLVVMACAATVARNGVTGQSIVEQFSSCILDPFVGGFALRAGSSLALPWAPVPEALTNDPFAEYVGDVGPTFTSKYNARSSFHLSGIRIYSTGVKPGDLSWNVNAPINRPRPKGFGPTFTSIHTVKPLLLQNFWADLETDEECEADAHMSSYGGMGGVGAPAGGNTAAMMSGTVKRWIGKKGFGFVAPADGGDTLFCHRSVFEDGQALEIGAPVMYVAGLDDQKGKMAITKLVGAVGDGGKGCGKGGGDEALHGGVGRVKPLLGKRIPEDVKAKRACIRETASEKLKGDRTSAVGVSPSRSSEPAGLRAPSLAPAHGTPTTRSSEPSPPPPSPTPSRPSPSRLDPRRLAGTWRPAIREATQLPAAGSLPPPQDAPVPARPDTHPSPPPLEPRSTPPWQPRVSTTDHRHFLHRPSSTPLPPPPGPARPLAHMPTPSRLSSAPAKTPRPPRSHPAGARATPN
jgi:cold shock CspA family protein